MPILARVQKITATGDAIKLDKQNWITVTNSLKTLY